MIKMGMVVCRSPRTVLCDQLHRGNFVSSSVIFHRFGVDDGFETIVAFPTAPNMMDSPLIPILGPFRGKQLITALGAIRPKGRTTIGNLCRHCNLPGSFPGSGRRLRKFMAKQLNCSRNGCELLWIAVISVPKAETSQSFVSTPSTKESLCWPSVSKGPRIGIRDRWKKERRLGFCFEATTKAGGGLETFVFRAGNSHRNGCVRQLRRSPKLSVVRDIRWQFWRLKLWVQHLSTMHGRRSKQRGWNQDLMSLRGPWGVKGPAKTNK